MMDGMEVTAFFVGGGSETVLWADTSAGAGAASGTGWLLSESGDTYGGLWTLLNNTGGGIASIFIDAGAGDSVYDVGTLNSTDGSASGWTFQVVAGGGGLDIEATYSDVVSLTGDAPVGDLWRNLEIAFTNAGGLGTGHSLTYITDTDNLEFAGDINPVPEPASVTLLVLGLAGLAARRKRSGFSKD